MAPDSYISCFAGAGAIDLGVRIVSPTAQCRGYVEINREAAEILAARIKEGTLDAAPVFSDIRSFPGRLFSGRVAGLVAGFPCPDYSVAGKRAGIVGKHGQLWDDLATVIRDVGPDWCLLENVPGILIPHRSGDEGWVLPAGLWFVLGDLATLGFDAQWLCLRASDVGASHGRNRWFCLAYKPGTKFDWCRLADTARYERAGERWAPGSRRGVCEAGHFMEDSGRNEGGREGDTGGSSPEGPCDPPERAGNELANAERSDSGGQSDSSLGRSIRGTAVNRPGEELAKPTRGGLRIVRQPSGREGQPYWGDEGLAYTGRQHEPRQQGRPLSQRSEGGPRPDYQRDSLADSGDGQFPESWRGSEGRTGLRPAVAVLGNTASQGPEESRLTGRGSGLAQGGGRLDDSERPVSELGYANRAGLEGRSFTGHEAWPGRQRAGEFAGPELANTGRERNERRGEPGELAGAGRQAEGEGLQRQRSGDAVSDSLSGLPIFAPGPGATKNWQELLVRFPWLRPAISQTEAESHLRGVVDGMAAMVADERTDALRAVGNGCVPLQVSVALVELARRAEAVNA